MIHTKDRLLLKSELSVWIFILLTHCSKGQYQVIGPTQPIVAMIGDDIELPCRLEPAVDAVDRTVEWSRLDVTPRFIHLRRGGEELLTEQNPSYKSRTSLSISKLKSGDISLKLSEVKLSDAGTYHCRVAKFDTESVVELAVGSISAPRIEISMDPNGVVLQCECAGWYPEPEVLWLDGEGKLLSAGPPETVRGPDDLYTVSSRVTLETRNSNTFICRVQQNNISQSRETQVHVSADLFMVHSNLPARITITMSACVLTVAAIVFIAWKWGQNKTTTMRQRDDEIELGERQLLTTSNSVELELLRGKEPLMSGKQKMEYLKRTKAILDDERQKNEEELEHVQQVIEVFKKQKVELKKQKEKLLSLQQEEKMKLKEIEKKDEEKFRMESSKKKEKRQKAKESTTQKNTEHEQLVEGTETLLETTEGMILTMTERKGKLLKDKEQIMKNLKHTQQEIEKLQRKLEESERKENKYDPSPHEQSTELLHEENQAEPEQPEEQNNP